ncbi:hypothetical protein MRB53_012130 [Persea americana]|uniref:Uncharacterized protein n=1 Tax=Persea americana TaxID=3435 RepID=A0ACC2LXD2_PERAE|nr:hypothetical protein MRB53_012130 [Persea americana]|eukprot:TRINITY_DN25662_c0_g1_i2.p1 TRINITY_DN25662_c0_g1~~TRINITY_DN25662_c0_g1_i2.p1  ORF type:complete len:668 (+),score=173.81 TRINITY_DN25662_c0_g1_i2:134-2137(+)
MLMKGMKDAIKPLILKLGVAFVLTFSGYLFSQFRNKRIGPNPSQSPGGKYGMDGRSELKNEEGVKQSAPEIEEMPQTPQKAVDRAAVGFSPTSKSFTDEEALLLPEFNELIQKEFDETGCSPISDVMGAVSPLVREMESVEPKRTDEDTRVMKQEIMELRNMVQELQDRERNLEAQLLEYYGLKEQDAIVRELQNRLKVNTMETQLFTLKIGSLQAENKRLEAQVSDYSKVIAELESARTKINQLQRKMRFDGEQAKEQLSALHQRVTAMHDQEHRAATNDTDSQKKLQRLKDLDDELMDIRRANSRLQSENSELASKLESSMLMYSALESTKAQVMEEANHLREANEDLEKKIERIQTDRCTEIEELVYLRWVNACLRYELRNYQPTPGKPVARDLGRTLSPKSEEKAKQLILEYANSGFEGSGLDLADFDSECGSSSQESTVTESEMDDISFDLPSTTRKSTLNKSKFISKLKRLVLGKDNHNNNKVASVDKTPTSCATSGRPASVGSLDDMIGTCSYDNSSSCTKVQHATSDLSMMETKPLYESSILVTPLKGTESRTEDQHRNISRRDRMARFSFDIQRLRKLSLEEIKERGSSKKRSDLGSLFGYERTVLGEGGVMELVHDNQLDCEHENTPEKLELKKYAQALSGSHGNPKGRRRSASFAY